MAWTPLPHEADLFCKVYIDESSQTKHRFLVLGGLVVPLSHADLFEADIIAARDHTTPLTKPDGTPKIMKWEKVNAYNIAAYKNVVEAFFAFPTKHNLALRKNVDIHCIAVDTSKKSLRKTGEGDLEIGFNKEVYFLCVPVLGKRFPKELFHIYPDRRSSNQPLEKARKIMNFGARKYGDKRLWPYRRVRYEDPENYQALQVVDIFIGALAYRLNGHHAKPDANPAKKELSEYILRRGKITDPFARSAYYRRRFTIVHRPGSPLVRKR